MVAGMAARSLTKGLEAQKANLHPELPRVSQAQLEELIHWAARARGDDGLDCGYFLPWEPPADVTSLKVSCECQLHACVVWVLKQLRSHRDALGRLASRLLEREAGLSVLGEEVASEEGTTLLSACIMNQLPKRLQALEERDKMLNARMDNLNREIINLPQAAPPLLRSSVTMPESTDQLTISAETKLSVNATISQKALQECRHSVTLLMDSQRVMIEQHDTMREVMENRIEEIQILVTNSMDSAARDLEEKWQRFQERFNELSSNHAVMQTVLVQQNEKQEEWQSGCNFRLETIEEMLGGMREELDGLEPATAPVADQAQKASHVEQSVSKIPGSSQRATVAVVSDRPPSARARLISSDPRVVEDIQAVAQQAEQKASQAVEAAREINEEAKDTLRMVFKSFKEFEDRFEQRFEQKLQYLGLKRVVSKQRQPDASKQKSERPTSAPGWPCRSSGFRPGVLPNLAPSSLAQKDELQKPRPPSAGNVEGLTVGFPAQADENEPEVQQVQDEASAQSHQEWKQNQKQPQQSEVSRQVYPLEAPIPRAGETQGISSVDQPPAKERYLPPTGGGFKVSRMVRKTPARPSTART